MGRDFKYYTTDLHPDEGDFDSDNEGEDPPFTRNVNVPSGTFEKWALEEMAQRRLEDGDYKAATVLCFLLHELGDQTYCVVDNS